MIRLTAFMDDKPSKYRDLISEHGLSYLLEAEGRRFLFDCGQGVNTWRNAQALGMDLHDLDGVILSHSHYDHAGGYRSLIESGGGSPVLYTGEGFWDEKCSFDGTACQSKGAGFEPGLLKNHGVTQQIVTGPVEIAPGVWLLGGFPRRCDYETIPQRFVRSTAAGFIWDDFRDEICLAVDVGGALAMVVGCSHPGIVNMVRHVRDTLDLPVRAVFGGAHLAEAAEDRIAATLRDLKALGVELFGLSHCSGPAAEAAIARNPDFQSCPMAPGDAKILK